MLNVKGQSQISGAQRSILGARLCRVQQRARKSNYQSKVFVCVSSNRADAVDRLLIALHMQLHTRVTHPPRCICCVYTMMYMWCIRTNTDFCVVYTSVSICHIHVCSLKYIVTCQVHPALLKQVQSRSIFFNFKWSVIRLTLSRSTC